MRIDESTRKPAPKIFKEDGRIDWRRSCRSIHNLVRGLSPYPAAWTPIFSEGAEVGSTKVFATHYEECTMSVAPGTMRTDGKTFIAVAAADGWKRYLRLYLLYFPARHSLKS